MNKSDHIKFTPTTTTTPFPHFTALSVFSDDLSRKIFNWFELTNEWHLIETNFYEQYEFSLLNVGLPKYIKPCISNSVVDFISNKISVEFNTKPLKLTEITAHKLINNQHIGIHNDYIGGEETHRFVVHITPHWTEDNGGYFMLFKSDDANDIDKLIKPINNSGIGFEISKLSNHAVSKINNYIRYSIVYTFSEKNDH